MREEYEGIARRALQNAESAMKAAGNPDIFAETFRKEGVDILRDCYSSSSFTGCAQHKGGGRMSYFSENPEKWDEIELTGVLNMILDHKHQQQVTRLTR